MDPETKERFAQQALEALGDNLSPSAREWVVDVCQAPVIEYAEREIAILRDKRAFEVHLSIVKQVLTGFYLDRFEQEASAPWNTMVERAEAAEKELARLRRRYDNLLDAIADEGYAYDTTVGDDGVELVRMVDKES